VLAKSLSDTPAGWQDAKMTAKSPKTIHFVCCNFLFIEITSKFNFTALPIRKAQNTSVEKLYTLINLEG
jgi:hypothetical protein